MTRSALHRRTEVIRPGRAFIWGLGLGIITVAALVTAALGVLAQRGVQVAISANEVAQVVRTEVQKQVETDMTGVLTQVKADAAAQIKEQMQNRIDAGAVRISDVVVPLPPEIVSQFQGRLESILLASLNSSLDSLDVKGMSQQYGDKASQMVRTSLAKQLEGRTFTYSPVSWLNIPITLRIQ
ncbi:MAG: hypothetical protein ACYC5Y_15645 [Symbiobacteriia bacterium]